MRWNIFKKRTKDSIIPVEILSGQLTVDEERTILQQNADEQMRQPFLIDCAFYGGVHDWIVSGNQWIESSDEVPQPLGIYTTMPQRRSRWCFGIVSKCTRCGKMQFEKRFLDWAVNLGRGDEGWLSR